MKKNMLIENYKECIEKFHVTTFEAYNSSSNIASMLMSNSIQDNDFKNAKIYSDFFIEFKAFYNNLSSENTN